MKHRPLRSRYEACLSAHFLIIYSSQTNWLFVFCPTIYPRKPPIAASGKLSSTPKPYKTAQLLRFFGKDLCHPKRCGLLFAEQQSGLSGYRQYRKFEHSLRIMRQHQAGNLPDAFQRCNRQRFRSETPATGIWTIWNNKRDSIFITHLEKWSKVNKNCIKLTLFLAFLFEISR